MSNLNKFQNWYETEVAQEITSKKYFHDGENFSQFVSRVKGIFSPDLQTLIGKVIREADFFPAGRSLYGAGSKGKFKATMSNCYIMPSPEDNIESIFDTAKQMARIFSYGGGAGVNISKLRPSGAKVSNAAKTSSGAVSFLQVFDSVGTVIGANNRRAALLLGLNCDHPDIEEFLTVKQNNDKIQSANLSILFTDEFMNAVRAGEQYTLSFKVGATNEFITKEINAKDFFMKFSDIAYDWGEPGCLFIDRIREYNLLSGYPDEEYHIDISNPCFTGDMKLLTASGYKTFAELDGKHVEVVSSNGDSSEDGGKVWCSGVKDVIQLNLSNGQKIKCTPDHVFSSNGGSCKAIDLKGKRLMPFLSSGEWWRWTNFERYGFIQGDGQLTRLSSESHKGLEVNIGILDEDILDLFECTREDLLGNGRTIYFSGHNGDLRKLGFSEKTLPERVMPTTYKSWDYTSKVSFLRGCYSANGSVLSCGRITYKTTCKQFAEELVEALQGLGIKAYVTTNKSVRVEFKNGDYTCKESYDVNIQKYESRVEFYNSIGFIQSYKDEKLMKLLVEQAPKVGSIVKLGSEKVYDFTEPLTHWGVVEGFIVHNCAEYLGNPYNSCNLGSLNLYNMVKNPFAEKAEIDYAKLKGTVELGINALDEILDYGYDNQPLPENKTCIDDWRAIGLGVFGLADMMIAMGIRYGSQESIDLVRKVMSFIWETAVMSSASLAKDKGTFGKYDWNKIKESPLIKMLDSSTRDFIKVHGLRNASLLSIAPTGSISTMAGLSGGVEPLFAVSYQRTTHALEAEGKFFKVYAKSVEHLLKTRGINPDDVTDTQVKHMFPCVVTTHDINPIERVNLQAVMQTYVDNAISSTVNLKKEATVQDVYDIYMAAWSKGCKGITVFRNECKRNAIMMTKPKPPETPKKFDHITPTKRGSLKTIEGTTVVGHTSCTKNLYTTVNKLEGDVFEVFTNASTGCKSNIGTITRLASLAIRSGIKVEEVIHELKANACPACGVLKQQGREDISLSCGGCVGEALEIVYGKGSEVVGLLECPSCGRKTLRPEGKCFNCNVCGYSRCD